jgi:hypothetical protein
LPTAVFLSKTSGLMNVSRGDFWKRFQQSYTEFSPLGLASDLSCMNFDDDLFATSRAYKRPTKT